MIQKSEWRKILLEKRKALSKERREEAAKTVFEKIKEKGTILSFTPIGSEIDLSLLNAYLERQNRLYLVPYQIHDFFHVDLSLIDCILVPGLGFDHHHYRLGYGQGYYDRFLKKASHILKIGVGFKEQLCEELLPKDPWDVPVDELLLV